MIPVSIELPSRVVATCLAPLTSTYDHRSGSVVVRGALYLDEAAYLAGAQPLEPPQDYRFSADGVRTALGGQTLDLDTPVIAMMAGHPRFALPAPAPEPEPQPEPQPE